MITVKNVYKTLKKKEVLKGIDLEINKGDLILLQGHNGCGKTMLLRLLCGLITPDRGSVCGIEGKSLGIIIENPSFIPSESAKDNLRFLAGINKKITDGRIDEYLKAFDLYDVRSKKVRTFSLGMKQRLALVQAVMEDPDILLLDEPFNAIDDENLNKTYQILDMYNQSGGTVIVASHGDYRDKCAFNRVITMSDGKITAIDDR